jgi:hypothetical protein
MCNSRLGGIRSDALRCQGFFGQGFAEVVLALVLALAFDGSNAVYAAGPLRSSMTSRCLG